ncbi:hypothetical protein [Bradyrhizobium sp. NC92]|uniref:hypothetical protein n=1 Tax=Bradyrhizobium sp. (strain NC92) TaxID=55395 RepID=UPI0021A9CFCB|nr:hypothetical protein [Bradyrhizobium sp. NC92]UWU70427.1 hypothetical protein N2602_07810 [Bradyrhizobium sp. NC92]
MIRKSVKRFSEEIMLNKDLKRDDDSSKSHRALANPRLQGALMRIADVPGLGCLARKIG